MNTSSLFPMGMRSPVPTVLNFQGQDRSSMLSAPRFGDDELGVGRALHDEGQPARVIGLGMVGDDDVDFGRVDDGPDVLGLPLLLEGGSCRVDQDGLRPG